VDGRERIVALAAAEPVAYQPGTRSLYSDLGFILLAIWWSADWAADSTRWPKGALRAPRAARYGLCRFASAFGPGTGATERCPVRGRMLSGEVHDLNAFAMGGWPVTPGFSPTLRTCFGWPAPCALPGAMLARRRRALVPAEVLRQFWQPAGIPGSTWRWAGTGQRSRDRSPDAACPARRWTPGFHRLLAVDRPERETCIVLLTNFIHPTVRKRPALPSAAPALHDAALDAIGYRA